jgi:chromosomal replication initiator protein
MSAPTPLARVASASPEYQPPSGTVAEREPLPFATGPEDSMDRARDARETFERVKRRLRADVGEEVYTSWFARLELDRLMDECARMSVPTPFLRNWISDQYARRLTDLWRKERPSIERVELVVRSTVMRPSSQKQAPRPVSVATTPTVTSVPAPAAAMPARGVSADGGMGSPLDPRYTFDSFVACQANRMACAAARQVADARPGEPLMFNPLYIHAGVGLGKTHLLQAIAAAIGGKGARKVQYLTAERFMFAFAAAFKTQNAVGLKEVLGTVDVLLVDDLQFLQGKVMQAEFCHMLNTLLDSGRQVVVAADRPPLDLESLEDRVRSRLSAGFAVEIGALDDDMRRDILKARVETARAAMPGFAMPAEVMDYVARQASQTGRDVDGAFTRLLAAHRLSGQPLTLELAEQILRDLVRNPDVRRVKIEDIQKIVAKHYNVSRADILSARRTANVVRPRQVAMYLAKQLTLRSLPEIGRRFGNRDHTTVLHAVRKIDGLLPTDTGLAGEVELLKRMLSE